VLTTERAARNQPLLPQGHAEGGIDLGHGHGLHVRQDMAVDIKGDARSRVPETFRDDLDRHPGLQPCPQEGSATLCQVIARVGRIRKYTANGAILK
jgi:hypothetical protein